MTRKIPAVIAKTGTTGVFVVALLAAGGVTYAVTSTFSGSSGPSLRTADDASSTTDSSNPENSAPDSNTPDNSAPDNSAPDNSAPDNSAPDNSAPDNSAPDNSAPDNSTPDNSMPTSDLVGGESATLPVLDVGSVDISYTNTTVRITSVDAADGWATSVEYWEGREVSVKFLQGEARIDFKAQVENGAVRIRIRDRRTDTRTETYIGEPTPGSTPSSSPSSSSPSSSTPATAPSSSSPSSSAPAAPAPVTTHSVASAGGQVTVTVQGDVVLLVSVAPTPGYAGDIRKGGPDKVEVRFSTDEAESRIELSADNGNLLQRVEDR